MNEPIYITIPPKYVSLVAPVVAEPASVKIKSEMKPLAIRPPSAGSDDEYSSMDEYVGGGSPRGKKRRLDHLTWEEKVQRKKLKNRVAAQTSRDRKKAKMEEMEQTIQEQADQIGELQHRCTALDAEKTAIFDKYLELERRFDELQQRLVAQESNQSAKNGSKKLVEQVDGGSVGCVTAGRQTGSAAGTEKRRTGGSANDTPADDEERRAADRPVEDHCHLPTLQDMLEDLDVAKLEELAESLLAGVGAHLESADRAGRPADAEGDRPGQRLSGSVVGPAAELVESGRPDGQSANPGSRLILTTHNYSKSPFYELSEGAQDSNTNPLSALQDDGAGRHLPEERTVTTAPTTLPNSDTLYGTYDNETNCITIVLTSDGEHPLVEHSETISSTEGFELTDEQQVFESESDEEMVCEASEEPQEDTFHSLGPIFIRPPSPLQDLLSPIGPAHHPLKSPGGFSSMSSDCGYESLGSPVSCISAAFANVHEPAAAIEMSECATNCCTTSTTSSDISESHPSTDLSLDYALNDFEEFWNLDLFPILE